MQGEIQDEIRRDEAREQEGWRKEAVSDPVVYIFLGLLLVSEGVFFRVIVKKTSGSSSIRHTSTDRS